MSETERPIDDVVASAGSTIVFTSDVETTALDLADRLSADLVEGASSFRASIADRERVLADRVAAHAALELTAREDLSGEEHVVTDVGTLRRLVERIATADRLVEASREAVQSRAAAASELAVHPTSIRDAADDVVRARAELEARNAALAEAGRTETGSDAAHVVRDPEPEVAPATPGPPRRFSGWELTDAGALRTPVIVVGVALVIGVLTLVLTGSPLALAIPGLAVCWVVVLIVRQRDDAYDQELASRNLESVARLTEQAYGGAGAGAQPASVVEEPSDHEAEAAVRDAENRLAFAEAAWRSLVGPDADVGDLESVIQARDARYRIGDHAVDELPAVRTADAHRRRLLAQWKLAWWVLDRPVPPMAAAEDALSALEAEGHSTVTIRTRAAGGLTADERQRLDELTTGRSADELRVAADATVPALVVADAAGEISAQLFQDATAHLPGDVRVVVVAPTD